LAPSEPRYPTTARPGHPNASEKQDSDLKSHLIKMIEDLKDDINNSLKEIQENTGQHAEALKEDTYKSLKQIEESTLNR
jgi:gas vesicle protein